MLAHARPHAFDVDVRRSEPRETEHRERSEAMDEPHRHAEEEFEGDRIETIEVGKRYPGRW